MTCWQDSFMYSTDLAFVLFNTRPFTSAKIKPLSFLRRCIDSTTYQVSEHAKLAHKSPVFEWFCFSSWWPRKYDKCSGMKDAQSCHEHQSCLILARHGGSIWINTFLQRIRTESDWICIACTNVFAGTSEYQARQLAKCRMQSKSVSHEYK